MICALVDERISDSCERGLLKKGFRVIKMPASDMLPSAMASHPDMLLFKGENEIIASAEYCEKYPYVFSDMRELAPNTKITLTDDVFAAEYPLDRIFNALVIGNNIFLKQHGISCAVLEYAQKKNLNIVKTNQGYPACTTLSFGNSAVTADEGMANALFSAGVKVTLISNADISLPPYEYGFIGGACGVFEKQVLFLGDIKRHRDFEKINAALLDEGYTAISLSDEPLCDLGRIIFIS